MKVIDGSGATLGRLASYAAKESLKGEEIRIVNCEEIIITGNKKDIIKTFEEKRKWVGSTQKGPKYSRSIDKVIKRVIRGMLPEHRWGRGRDAYKRIKCYIGLPAEFENSKIEKLEKRKDTISHKIGEVIR
jgi:large subunit ribosomal protein L13